MDLEELSDNLQNLIEEINNGVEHTTKELGQESLRYMKKQFAENELGSHTGILQLHADNGRYKNGFVISLADGNQIENTKINEKTLVVYNEFGIGMVGEGSGELADLYNYQYNVSSRKKGYIPPAAKRSYGEDFCEAVTDDDTWWYFKDGRWWWSRGYEGKNMFASLADELNNLAPQQYKGLIDGLVAKYGRKK